MIWILIMSSLAISFAQAEPALPAETRSAMRWTVDHVDELLGGTRTDDNKSESTLHLTFQDGVNRFEPPDPQLNIRYLLKLGILTRWQNELQSWFDRKWQAVEKDVASDFENAPSHPHKLDAGSGTYAPSEPPLCMPAFIKIGNSITF